MPIITPAYPQQNSAYNVTTSTRSIIISEIKRGLETCQEINANKSDWHKLFEPKNFFNRYKYFFMIQKVPKLTPNDLKHSLKKTFYRFDCVDANKRSIHGLDKTSGVKSKIAY
jgi:poly(A) polymerase Pap1